ncbi:MAG: aspartate aminotransferase family protein [Syntrophomonadaceae bacterium]|nr:aspartate aminotransferase family protein [Syntrophomonadaceae bacterium]
MYNEAIIEEAQKYVMNTYGRFPMVPVRGEGCWLWDADGTQYLDCVSGIAVCALGHADPRLQAVLKEQAENLWHCSNLYWIPNQAALAKKLVEISGMGKAFFCNSGAEANEAAIKLVRKYFYRRNRPEKYEIIVFNHSFHGRTLAALTATGQKKYQEGFAPLPAGFVYAEYNDLDSVRALINEHTAAILAEPIQGESGIHPADPDFLAGLRALCDENELLLVFDEVQCGMGRTGDFFAWQGYGVRPDIVTMAKALAGGFPIGAMIASDEAAGGFAPGDHASTFGGNPLATAVACAVVDIIGEPEFLERVKARGEGLAGALSAIRDPRITAVRGRGLMVGIQFDREIKDLIAICMENGLLVVGAGPNVLRLVPPLTILPAEIGTAVSILKTSLEAWVTV